MDYRGSEIVNRSPVTLTPSLTLPSPFLSASGTLGFTDTIQGLVDLIGCGGYITPTITRHARNGNPMPRTVEATAGLIHATGYPNPGIDAFLENVYPNLTALPCPLIINIAGETPSEWQYLASRLQEMQALSALELNLNPFDPQAVPSEHESLIAIHDAVKAVRQATSLPLIAKLPAVGAEVGRAAKAAVEAGADSVSVGQAFPAVAVRFSSREFRLPQIVGGLSGPAIKPLALYQTWRVAQVVDVPIIGGGGIMSHEDEEEFFVAGAKAVAIGIASMIHPSTLERLTKG